MALSLWVKLSRASATMGKLSKVDIESYGLTPPQFSVIESLGHLGPMLMGKLCSKLLVTGGNITVVIDNLEKEGLVERIPSKEDRRAIMVQLTRKGQSLFDKIFIKHAHYVEKAMSVLTQEEQVQLSGLLKKLGLALQNKL